MKRPPLRPRTRVNHPERVAPPPGNEPLVAPVYQSVKFAFPTVAETERLFRGEGEGFFYSRAGNPTTAELERLLAELQGRTDCLVTGSGVAAVATALLTLLKQGDHVLCFAESYGPTRWLIRRLLGRYGVEHTLLSVDDREGIERTLATRPTRLVWFETPTNPALKVVDVAWFVDCAHRHGALAVLDNTLAGFHQHARFPVDLYVHSLTKYAAGHGDVMGGALVGDAALLREIRAEATHLGPTLDPHAAFLVLRGLRTYHLRRAAQCANAARVAAFLEGHPRVARVRYPGLASHPGHEVAREQGEDYGTLVTLDLEGGAEHARRFVDALQLFAIAASLGSTESLAMPPQLLGTRDLPAELRAGAWVGETTVRLSLGIEDPEDLLEDLARALDAAGA